MFVKYSYISSFFRKNYRTFCDSVTRAVGGA